MATDNKRGFVPARQLTGGAIRTRRYFVPSDMPAIAIGDAVQFNPNGDGVVALSGDATTAQSVLGVAVALYDTNNKPLTFSQPARGPYLPASTGGYVDVADDPFTTFIVQVDASVTSNNIGQFIGVSAVTNSVSTAKGTSTMQVKAASIDTTVRQFQIIGVAPTESDGLGSILNRAANGANIDVEVRMVTHIFNRTVA